MIVIFVAAAATCVIWVPPVAMTHLKQMGLVGVLPSLPRTRTKRFPSRFGRRSPGAVYGSYCESFKFPFRKCIKFSQPSVIIAVFLFLGTAVFLFIKARKGFAYFANYFSACICLGACLYGIRKHFN